MKGVHMMKPPVIVEGFFHTPAAESGARQQRSMAANRSRRWNGFLRNAYRKALNHERGVVLRSTQTGFQATLAFAEQDWDKACPSLHKGDIPCSSLYKRSDLLPETLLIYGSSFLFKFR